jgi:hypothetical protein
VGDGAGSGFGGELPLGLEAVPDVGKPGEGLGSVDAACALKRHDDLAVREVGDGLLDGGRELGGLGDEPSEDASQGAGRLAAGVGLGIPGEAARPGGRAGQLGVRAASAAGVPCHEAGRALLAEAQGAFGGRMTADKGERDRTADVGPECRRRAGCDGDCSRPEAFERAARPIGRRHAPGDRVVPAAYRRTRRPDLIRQECCERAEAVAVPPVRLRGPDGRLAQSVGRHVGVAWAGGAALAADGAAARAAGLGDAGADWDDRGRPASTSASMLDPEGRSTATGSSAGGPMRLSRASSSASPAASRRASTCVTARPVPPLSSPAKDGTG